MRPLFLCTPKRRGNFSPGSSLPLFATTCFSEDAPCRTGSISFSERCFPLTAGNTILMPCSCDTLPSGKRRRNTRYSRSSSGFKRHAIREVPAENDRMSPFSQQGARKTKQEQPFLQLTGFKRLSSLSSFFLQECFT